MTHTPTRKARRPTRTQSAHPAPHGPATPDTVNEQAVTMDQAALAAASEAATLAGAALSASTDTAAPELAEPPALPSPADKVTKAAQLQALLAAPKGVTLAGLCEALGWQAHTVRAALTRLRQAGHAVERSRAEDGQTLYHIGPGGSVGVGSGEATAAEGGTPGATEAAPLENAAQAPDATVSTPTSVVSGTEEWSIPESPHEVMFGSGRMAAASQVAGQDGEGA